MKISTNGNDGILSQRGREVCGLRAANSAPLRGKNVL